MRLFERKKSELIDFSSIIMILVELGLLQFIVCELNTA